MFPRAWFKPQLMGKGPYINVLHALHSKSGLVASRTVTVMEPTPFFQIPALDNTYGAILMGSNISLMYVCSMRIVFLGGHLLMYCYFGRLYGFNLHQAYRYFRQFPNDSRFVKLVVSCLPLHHRTNNVDALPQVWLVL